MKVALDLMSHSIDWNIVTITFISVQSKCIKFDRIQQTSDIRTKKKKKKKRETDWPKVSDFAIYVKHSFYVRAHAAKETYKTNTLGDYFV